RRSEGEKHADGRKPMRNMKHKDRNAAVDYEEPAFLRKKKHMGEESESEEYPDYEGKIIDHDDLEIPTFLRKKAD
ncbi:MAG: cell division protein FtsZ, partial [Thermodesulfobacteriota bacterium]